MISRGPCISASVLLFLLYLTPGILSEGDEHNHHDADDEDGKKCETTFCEKFDYGPQSAYVPCNFLPYDFLECQEPTTIHVNTTQNSDEDTLKVNQGVHSRTCTCTVLNDIECYGNRTFSHKGLPCQQHRGHYFVTTLLFSLLLGFLGMDRFYLGHTGTAIGKMLTIGGVGIWWIVDIILLVTGYLMPEDGSDWMPYA